MRRAPPAAAPGRYRQPEGGKMAPGAYSGLPAAGEEIFGAFQVHFHEFASEIVSYFYNTPSFYVAQLQLLLINILHCKNHLKSSVWTAVCRTVQIGQIRF